MGRIKVLVAVVSLIVLYFGFKFVTQSGLEGAEGSVQNDGYAVSGGLLILLAGLKMGWLLKEMLSKKK